jgi:hypothetical protein
MEKMQTMSVCGALLLLLPFGHAQAADVFDNVALFERALVPAGLPVAKWRAMSGLFSGSSQIMLPNSQQAVISYAFMGTTATRVTRANISTLVHSAVDVPTANTKLAEVTAQWFKAIGIAVPAGLLPAIRAGRPFAATATRIRITISRQAQDVIVLLQPM